jgi:mRNA interferase RelE/StbE
MIPPKEFGLAGLAPLRDTLSGFHSPRLGAQWRVLYRIDESKHAVIVQDNQHRSSAYRRR